MAPFGNQLGKSNVELALGPGTSVPVRNGVWGKHGDGENYHQPQTDKTPH